ncbi:hypothetical protein Aca07nite_67520 [Actinoplanes capillaceus]|uniref:Uncharacterized protein n=1 Tax=Actinoplanes campanulatus TaxID=113559 RepID=A0ABQ3WT66_9ACTN|nr:hypothetical protein [Actinoplanes capillaceus]GID49477.1 hypothetical protein Aca07nite_67520 [Actinoplanes capillaceus]
MLRLRQSSRPLAPAITATARAIHQATREPPKPVAPVVPAVCSAAVLLAGVADAAVGDAAVLGGLLGVVPAVTSA